VDVELIPARTHVHSTLMSTSWSSAVGTGISSSESTSGPPVSDTWDVSAAPHYLRFPGAVNKWPGEEQVEVTMSRIRLARIAFMVFGIRVVDMVRNGMG
jgi:hypothetical protein